MVRIKRTAVFLAFQTKQLPLRNREENINSDTMNNNKDHKMIFIHFTNLKAKIRMHIALARRMYYSTHVENAILLTCIPTRTLRFIKVYTHVGMSTLII